MKILVCNKFYRPVGGPETIVFETIRELRDRGHEAIPFAMAHPQNWESEYSDHFVPTVDYNTRRGPSQLLRESVDLVYSKEARRRVERLIADTKPDIAHAHNIYHQLSPSILVALKKAGIPTVMTLHDGKLLCANMIFFTHNRVCEKCRGRWFHHAVTNRCVKDSFASSMLCGIEGTLHRLLKITERNVDLFISPSQFLKDKLVEHKRLREDQITVLHNYGNTTTISPDYKPGDYGLYMGKVETFKGVGTLLKACRSVPDFEIRIAGRGDYLEEAQRIVEEERITNAKLLGFQTGGDLIRLIRECRFVVVPSEWYENCPMVVLEGFCAGKPVIGSKIGGIPELINHGEDGFLFEPGDADGLASHMRALIENPALSEEMGRKGRNKVDERFAMDKYMDALLGIYRSVLK